MNTRKVLKDFSNRRVMGLKVALVSTLSTDTLFHDCNNRVKVLPANSKVRVERVSRNNLLLKSGQFSIWLPLNSWRISNLKIMES